ncbi:hypothetical protein [Nonomuraea sp. NPDC050202]|uniref:hypothetical protein n=1 Tax=Nonomuraea sp. NPDC050202 TaxID=3155035 RepID=UPI0033D1348B
MARYKAEVAKIAPIEAGFAGRCAGCPYADASAVITLPRRTAPARAGTRAAAITEAGQAGTGAPPRAAG